MQSLESGSGQNQYVAIGEAVSFCFWHQRCHSPFVKVFQILKCSFCKFSWVFVFHCEEAGYWVVILKFCDRVCGQQWWAAVSSRHCTVSWCQCCVGSLSWLAGLVALLCIYVLLCYSYTETWSALEKPPRFTRPILKGVLYNFYK